MTSIALTHPANNEFVAYEYATVRAPRDLAPLYQDTYRSFGWTETNEAAAGQRPRTVELGLKRDRNIRARSAIAELERKAERALTNIGRLSSSPHTVAMTAAITIGLVGTAFVAGSVFALPVSLVLSVVLGVIGLLGWAGGAAAYIAVRSRRAAKLAARVDDEYRVVYECSEQATRLLA